MKRVTLANGDRVDLLGTDQPWLSDEAEQQAAEAIAAYCELRSAGQQAPVRKGDLARARAVIDELAARLDAGQTPGWLTGEVAQVRQALSDAIGTWQR